MRRVILEKVCAIHSYILLLHIFLDTNHGWRSRVLVTYSCATRVTATMLRDCSKKDQSLQKSSPAQRRLAIDAPSQSSNATRCNPASDVKRNPSFANIRGRATRIDMKYSRSRTTQQPLMVMPKVRGLLMTLPYNRDLEGTEAVIRMLRQKCR